MLGPQGKLVVKELGLYWNLEGRPGLSAGKKATMGLPGRGIAAAKAGLLAEWSGL